MNTPNPPPEGCIIVCHARTPNFMSVETGHPQPPWPQDFDVVALVSTDDMDRAFEATNHIDHPWQENKDVCPFFAKARSTSVGDVLLLQDGRAMRVAGIGFSEVEVA
tara:strand:- start:587 stop:907 length:321 start_codon:yes stop_codon:yes gene_type:complete